MTLSGFSGGVLTAAMLAVLVALSLMVIRVLKGPTTFDRLVATNSIGNGAILMVALTGYLTGRPDFLDLGLTYALLNLIGTFAVLKFFDHGALGAEGRAERREGER